MNQAAFTRKSASWVRRKSRRSGRVCIILLQGLRKLVAFLNQPEGRFTSSSQPNFFKPLLIKATCSSVPPVEIRWSMAVCLLASLLLVGVRKDSHNLSLTMDNFTFHPSGRLSSTPQSCSSRPFRRSMLLIFFTSAKE